MTVLSTGVHEGRTLPFCWLLQEHTLKHTVPTKQAILQLYRSGRTLCYITSPRSVYENISTPAATAETLPSWEPQRRRHTHRHRSLVVTALITREHLTVLLWHKQRVLHSSLKVIFCLSARRDVPQLAPEPNIEPAEVCFLKNRYFILLYIIIYFCPYSTGQ